MNRIKIIKRTELQSPTAAREPAAKKTDPALIKRQAEEVVKDWINNWRASKPQDARRAFADLFGIQSSASS